MNAVERLRDDGFCVLRGVLSRQAVEACRDAVTPRLAAYMAGHDANRGPDRHFMAMPFAQPAFSPDFFFNPDVLAVVMAVLGERIVVDQWGCDTPLKGSITQNFHIDFRRPLFEEVPDLVLPPYMLMVSFGLVDIAADNGAMEIAPGTHHMPVDIGLSEIAAGRVVPVAVTLDIGDVLVRHPWALHRGTPNRTDAPRPLVSLRYVRRWFYDTSRDVEVVSDAVWQSLSPDQQALMRFPHQR